MHEALEQKALEREVVLLEAPEEPLTAPEHGPAEKGHLELLVDPPVAFRVHGPGRAVGWAARGGVEQVAGQAGEVGVPPPDADRDRPRALPDAQHHQVLGVDPPCGVPLDHLVPRHRDRDPDGRAAAGADEGLLHRGGEGGARPEEHRRRPLHRVEDFEAPRAARAARAGALDPLRAGRQLLGRDRRPRGRAPLLRAWGLDI
mmetsp:Transcript_40981/g.92242  ORF Transcript_40981/g.92242 Transcript_40981/m.92242 type:complete len:202 (+) Transcript_40981:515-1120(+)